MHCEKALEINRKVLGDEHPDTAQSFNNVGLVLHSIGDYSVARPYFKKSLAIYKKTFGMNHPNTKRVVSNLDILVAAKKRSKRKTGRNEPCPCGSGMKLKMLSKVNTFR